MKKEEYIRKYGKAAWEKKLQQTREWQKTHREEIRESNRLWQLNNPEKVRAQRRLYAHNHPDKIKAKNQEETCKGGKYYERRLKYESIGLPYDRKLVRSMHRNRYLPYKQIIAPDSQIHHEWIPETANYRGVALVEKDPHMHGFVDVIRILEGEITLLMEAEILKEEQKC